MLIFLVVYYINPTECEQTKNLVNFSCYVLRSAAETEEHDENKCYQERKQERRSTFKINSVGMCKGDMIAAAETGYLVGQCQGSIVAKTGTNRESC